MRRRVDDPLAAIDTGAYSPALGAAPWMLVSDQGSLRPDRSNIQGDIAAQTRAAPGSIRRLIEAAGGSMDPVVECTCNCDITQSSRFGTAYRAAFSELYPTRTTAEAGLDGVRVAIDAMAYLGGDR